MPVAVLSKSPRIALIFLIIHYIGFTCRQISHLPMLAPGSMVFDR